MWGSFEETRALLLRRKAGSKAALTVFESMLASAFAGEIPSDFGLK